MKKKLISKIGGFVALGMVFLMMSCQESGLVFVEGSVISTPIENSEIFVEGRTVVINDFYISDHEVTQYEYFSVMGRNPSYFSRNPAVNELQENRPVECVSWYDAIVYCNKKSIQEKLKPCYSMNGSVNPEDWGIIPSLFSEEWNKIDCDFSANGYRLPTEVEWEYVARGGEKFIGDGSRQYTYSGSDTIDNVAWYEENSNGITHEVKKKDSNQLDIYDMSGNVSEWCWDLFSNYSEGSDSVEVFKTSRVSRNGNWGQSAFNNTVYSRGNDNPAYRSNGLGFRVVQSK